MEHAVWLKKSGEEEYVSIKKVKDDLGEDGAREKKYRCPSKKCRVSMITVFPKKARLKGKEAHIDHFRASPVRHKDECEGDGQREEEVAAGPTEETGVKPRHEVVEQGGYPVRYVKRARRPKAGDVEPGAGIAKPGLDVESGRKGRATGEEVHTSESETGHIRKMVEAYENPPFERSRMKIDVPGCAARNYEDAFVDVAHGVDGGGNPRGYYVYKGPYSAHDFYTNGAIAIIFGVTSGDGKKLGVWIKHELGPEPAREVIRNLLKRAGRGSEATVYVVGEFRRFGSWKHSVEVEALGDVWITFPEDADPIR